MAGSTNILIWNPAQNSQESDGNYATDTQRVNGATDPSIFPTLTANKAFNQWSTIAAQLAAALAAKGYTCLDSNAAAMLTAMAAILTFADMAPNPIAFSATPVFDCSTQLMPMFTMTLTGNVTAINVTNVVPGQRVLIIFTQDGTGSRTVAYPSNIVGGGSPDPAANSVNVQSFVVLADNKLHAVTAVSTT